jgi:hypothetical protein
MRKETTNALSEWWGSEHTPLYCPLSDLVLPTMLKIKREKALGALWIPNWEAESASKPPSLKIPTPGWSCFGPTGFSGEVSLAFVSTGTAATEICMPPRGGPPSPAI